MRKTIEIFPVSTKNETENEETSQLLNKETTTNSEANATQISMQIVEKLNNSVDKTKSPKVSEELTLTTNSPPISNDQIQHDVESLSSMEDVLPGENKSLLKHHYCGQQLKKFRKISNWFRVVMRMILLFLIIFYLKYYE